jgi:hypothetical protein
MAPGSPHPWLNLTPPFSLFPFGLPWYWWVEIPPFFFFCGTGIWTHGLHLQGRRSPLEPLHQPINIPFSLHSALGLPLLW